MNVFELFASLTLDTSEYDKGLDNAEKGASNFGSTVAKGLGTAAAVGATAVTAVATATTAVTGAMVSATKETAEYGDNIDKMSQKLGISAEAYQEWDAVLQHSGTSIESMSATFKTLSNAAQDASADQQAAFEAIGLSMEEVSSLATEDLFAKVVEGLQGMEEGTERTAYASDLLGRGAMELGALLNTSAEDTQAMRDRVHELGGVMSDEAVKAAAGFQDSLQDMQTSFEGLQRNLVSDMLPSITQVMDGLANIFSGNETEGLAQVGEGIDSFLDNMSNILPKVVTLGTNIVQSLASSIVENLPKLFKLVSDELKNIADFLPSFVNETISALAGLLPDAFQTVLDVLISLMNGLSAIVPELIPTIVEALLNVVQVIVDNAGVFLDAATSLVDALLEGILAALPVLLQMMPNLLTSMVEALLRGILQMNEAGVDMIGTLFEGIVEATPALLEMIGTLIPQMVIAILELLPELNKMSFEIFEALQGYLAKYLPDFIVALVVGAVECIGAIRESFDNYDWIGIGVQIMQGIIDGIKSMVSSMWGAAKEVVSGLVDGFKSALDMHSPSRVMYGLGQLTMEGFDNGMEDTIPDVQGMVDDMLVEPKLALSAEGIGGINMAAGLNGLQVIAPVYIGQTLIDTVITDAMTRQAYTSGGR